MKYVIAIFIFILCYLPNTSAQQQEQLLQSTICKHLKSGNATALQQHLSPSVQVKLSKKVYHGKKAQAIIHNFFKQYPPKDFQLKHKGQANKSVQFFVGILTTNNKKFRTHVVLRDSKIHQLSFTMR